MFYIPGLLLIKCSEFYCWTLETFSFESAARMVSGSFSCWLEIRFHLLAEKKSIFKSGFHWNLTILYYSYDFQIKVSMINHVIVILLSDFSLHKLSLLTINVSIIQETDYWFSLKIIDWFAWDRKIYRWSVKFK